MISNASLPNPDHDNPAGYGTDGLLNKSTLYDLQQLKKLIIAGSKITKMETTLKKSSRFHLSEKAKEITIDAVAYVFIALFIYTATDKFWNMEVFVKFMSRLDLIHATGKYIAWLIPITEIVISIFLMVPITRKKGLIASGALMTVFTLYLIYMKIFIAVIPCHCGGVISKLSWTEHIWFNLIFILLAGISIFFSHKNTNITY